MDKSLEEYKVKWRNKDNNDQLETMSDVKSFDCEVSKSVKLFVIRRNTSIEWFLPNITT